MPVLALWFTNWGCFENIFNFKLEDGCSFHSAFWGYGQISAAHANILHIFLFLFHKINIGIILIVKQIDLTEHFKCWKKRTKCWLWGNNWDMCWLCAEQLAQQDRHQGDQEECHGGLLQGDHHHQKHRLSQNQVRFLAFMQSLWLYVHWFGIVCACAFSYVFR